MPLPGCSSSSNDLASVEPQAGLFAVGEENDADGADVPEQAFVAAGALRRVYA